MSDEVIPAPVDLAVIYQRRRNIMTPEKIRLIQESFERVKTIPDKTASMFYTHLFEMDPRMVKLFEGSNMAEQGRKLMTMITAAVNSLGDIEAVIPTLQDLGRRHVDYGVVESQYDTVGSALLWTLEQGLGPEFTPEVKEAWATVYSIVAKAMIDAAADVKAA